MLRDHKKNKEEGDHIIKKFHIQPYEFIYQRMTFLFFKGNVIKYVCRYKNKAGIQDLEKIIHYCELEIKTMKDMGKKRNDITTNRMVTTKTISRYLSMMR